MNSYKNLIKSEISKSLSKVKRSDGTINELSKKMQSFHKEIEYLNKQVIKIAENYINKNNCTDKEIEEINKINKELLQDFLNKGWSK